MALSQLQSDVMAVLSPSVIDDVYYPGLEGRALMSFECLEGAINPLCGMSSQPGYEEGNLQECDVADRRAGSETVHSRCCAAAWSCACHASLNVLKKLSGRQSHQLTGCRQLKNR